MIDFDDNRLTDFSGCSLQRKTEPSQKFYCTVLRARKELILDRALERVQKEERVSNKRRFQHR